MHRHLRSGVDALPLQADEILCQRREARIDLRQFVLLVVEGFDHPVDGRFRHVGTGAVAEQDRHTLQHGRPHWLGEGALRVDIGHREARGPDRLDLVRARIDHPKIDAKLGLLPVGRKLRAGRGVGDRAHDGASFERFGMRFHIDLHVLEVVAEHPEDALEVQPVHESGRRVEHRLAAEILPAFEALSPLGRSDDHRLHRIGVPGVYDLGLQGLEVLEAFDTLVELAHADVGGVGDLAFPAHRRFHGDDRRRVGLDRY